MSSSSSTSFKQNGFLEEEGDKREGAIYEIASISGTIYDGKIYKRHFIF